MWKKFIPCLRWLGGYRRQTFNRDLVAALIVCIMLIPQSMGYALLAGLPPQTGLYASMLPLVAYAIFGTSRTLAVGPVAVVSLITAVAITEVSATGILNPLQAAILLAWLSGVFLLLMALFRAGFVTNFLPYPVIAGFISAAGLLVALSQVRYLLGIPVSGATLPALLESIVVNSADTNMATLAIGGSALLFLFWARTGLKRVLQLSTLSEFSINTCVRAAPILAVIVTSLAALLLRLEEKGLGLLGFIPPGLPPLQLPIFSMDAVWLLVWPAIMISVIGYVESVSVGRTLAERRTQEIDPNQELIGLGSANIASALSGSLPVSGGFSRSVINFDAGAQTPAANFFTAVGIGFTLLWLTDLLAWLPTATLAAIIIIAVLRLVDFSVLKQTWDFSVPDFVAVAATMLTTLLLGVEAGATCGLAASLLLHLYKKYGPDIGAADETAAAAPASNVKRHQVGLHSSILTLQVDDTLFLPTASCIEEEIFLILKTKHSLKHVVLMCTTVKSINSSAMEVLATINHRLHIMDIGFHFSELSDPVMEALKTGHLLEQLHGRIFQTQEQALQALQ